MAKRYYEIVATASATTLSGDFAVGLGLASAQTTDPLGSAGTSWGYYANGVLLNSNTTQASGTGYTVGDVIGVKADYVTGDLFFYVNNTPTVSYLGALTTGEWFPMAIVGQSETASAHFSEVDWTYNPGDSYSYNGIIYVEGGPNYAESWDQSNTVGSLTFEYGTAATVASTASAAKGLLSRDYDTNTGGQYYFRIIPGTYGSATLKFGVLFGSSLVVDLGQDTNSIVMRHNGTNGEVFTNGSVQSYIPYSNGDPFDVYLDFDTGMGRIEHFASGYYDFSFDPYTIVTPVFSGVNGEVCTLHTTNGDLDGNHLNPSYSSYLAWHDGL